jgi:hypothetical protein
MKFISIFTVEPGKAAPPDADSMANMTALIKEFSESGVLIDTGGVAPTGTSLRVAGTGKGPVVVTDGPFAESKEVLGGYAVLNVTDREHLLAVVRRFLACAGGGTCTLHELADMPDDTRA